MSWKEREREKEKEEERIKLVRRDKSRCGAVRFEGRGGGKGEWGVRGVRKEERKGRGIGMGSGMFRCFVSFCVSEMFVFLRCLCQGDGESE